MPEQTAGQRIAERWMLGYDFRADVAADIDEAIREAREDAHKELGGLLFHDLARRLISRISVAADKSQSDWSDIELSLVRIIQKAEQLAAKEAEIREAREEGCTEGRLSGKRAMQELMRSHSELQKQLAAKEADCAAMRSALQAEQQTNCRCVEWNCSQPDCGETHERTCSSCDRINAALASNAGEALLARLRAAEETAAALEAAAQSALSHVLELRAAWERGIITEHDCGGGTRSNRNVDVECALRCALQAARAKEPTA